MLQIIELKVVLLEQYSKLLMSVSLLVCEVFTFCECLSSVANSTLTLISRERQCVLSVKSCTKPFIKTIIYEVNSFKILYFGSTVM